MGGWKGHDVKNTRKVYKRKKEQEFKKNGYMGFEREWEPNYTRKKQYHHVVSFLCCSENHLGGPQHQGTKLEVLRLVLAFFIFYFHSTFSLVSVVCFPLFILFQTTQCDVISFSFLSSFPTQTKTYPFPELHQKNDLLFSFYIYWFDGGPTAPSRSPSEDCANTCASASITISIASRRASLLSQEQPLRSSSLANSLSYAVTLFLYSSATFRAASIFPVCTSVLYRDFNRSKFAQMTLNRFQNWSVPVKRCTEGPCIRTANRMMSKSSKEKIITKSTTRPFRLAMSVHNCMGANR
mmetsp:Transcript_30575/g.79743  ORF Transcript_30575/g.79743 Transcript_30575/m.79743 type:complete len:295 (-) Transcript_30575:6277-7161(-)